VGTKKGAFILTSDGKRKDWQVSTPLFTGWEIYHSPMVVVRTGAGGVGGGTRLSYWRVAGGTDGAMAAGSGVYLPPCRTNSIPLMYSLSP